MHSRVSLGRLFRGAMENYWHRYTRHWSDLIRMLHPLGRSVVLNTRLKALLSVDLDSLAHELEKGYDNSL